MKPLRMRAFHRSVLVLASIATLAGPAFAQAKKGDKAPAPAKGGAPAPAAGGDGEPEIEMDPNAPPDKPADGGEIDMGEPAPGDLAADMAASDAAAAAAVKAGPVTRTKLSW